MLNNCSFINVITFGGQKSRRKKCWKMNFSNCLEAIIDFICSRKCSTLYLFIWNYSGKLFQSQKLVWDRKARLSAISSTSHALLHCYLEEDLSQHLLSANGVTPCRHCFIWIGICTRRGLGFKSGPSPSEGIAMQKHTCAHTHHFFFHMLNVWFNRMKNIRSKKLTLLLHEHRVHFYCLGTCNMEKGITRKELFKWKL